MNKELLKEFYMEANKKPLDISGLKKFIDKGLDINEADESGCSLYTNCVLEMGPKKLDCLELLKCFCEELSFDLNKYSNDVISTFYLLNEDFSVDYIEMTKYILNNSNTLDIDTAIEKIGMHASWYNCSFVNQDIKSNDLYAVVELLKSYKQTKDCKGFFGINSLPRRFLEQKILGVYVNSSNTKYINGNIYINDSNIDEDVVVLVLEKSVVVIKNNFSIYINNNENYHKYINNNHLQKFCENETFYFADFFHTTKKIGNKSYSQGREIYISLSNRKRLYFTYDRESKINYIKLLNLNSKNVCEQFSNVFIDKDLHQKDILNGKYYHSPDGNYSYKIFHNCTIEEPERLYFYKVNLYEKFKGDSLYDYLTSFNDSAEYMTIYDDIWSTNSLNPVLYKVMPGFDWSSLINLITRNTYEKFQKELLIYIDALKKRDFLHPYVIKCMADLGYISPRNNNNTSNMNEKFDDKIDEIVAFLEAFDWYLYEYLSIYDDSFMVNIMGY